ncbi:MAG: hypothetical protein IKK50_09460 [Ruminiclostridium sp.]|nr:hypothetical protein [Ruminiclostridium sp.]
MKIKWLPILLAVTLISGCQLAQEDTVTSDVEDRLIGLFVSKDARVSVDQALDENGRYYATIESRTTINPSTGEETTNEVYTFPDLDGMYYYFILDRSDPEVVSTISGPNEGVFDQGTGVEYTDGVDRMKLKASFYAARGSDMESFHGNPIYMTADGEVYVTSGGAGLMFHDSEDEGSMGSVSERQASTIQVGGETESWEISATASFAYRSVPRTIVLLQMDDQGNCLHRTEFDPGQAPERLTPEGETAYFIVESWGTKASGEPSTIREIVDREEEYLITWYLLDNGFFMNQVTYLDWEG